MTHEDIGMEQMTISCKYLLMCTDNNIQRVYRVGTLWHIIYTMSVIEPVKPNEGVQKQGGNQDPKSWKIVNMRNPPEKFKVVDDANKRNSMLTIICGNRTIQNHHNQCL
jgi:hypothetical protein